MAAEEQRDSDFLFDAGLAILTLVLAICAFAFATSGSNALQPYSLRFSDNGDDSEMQITINGVNELRVNGERLEPTTSLQRYMVDQDLRPDSAVIRTSSGALSDGVFRVIQSLRQFRVRRISVLTT